MVAAAGFALGVVLLAAYSVPVGSPKFCFHAVGLVATGMVVAVSLVLLIDLAYPFSGVLSVSPDHFKTGELAQFFTQR